MEDEQNEYFDEEQEYFENDNYSGEIKQYINHEEVFLNESLNPEKESQFIDYGSDFEEALQNSNQITVYDYIGRPACKKSNAIPDIEIGMELENLMELMNQNQIILDVNSVIDDRVLYEFITEELFLTEADDMRQEGMTRHFIYEDFYPNHKFDIENNCFKFIDSFLNIETDSYMGYLTKEAGENRWFENFRSSFYTFNLGNLEIKEINIIEKHANAVLNISFTGIIDGTNETEGYSGLCEIILIHKYDFWLIQKISLPPKI